MNCPKCKTNNVGQITTDSIPCGECGSVLTVDYWLCGACSASFRSVNGKVFDSFELDEGLLRNLVNEMMSAMEQLEPSNRDGCGNCGSECTGNCTHDDSPMASMIHHCLKCGAIIIQDPSISYYKCQDCGFTWEIV
jgi:hypothetical protein